MRINSRVQNQLLLRQKIALIIFGLVLTLIILEAGLRLGGFIFSSLQDQRNLISIRQRGTYRIMCLGESTTVGQYPVFLEQVLNQRNIGIRFSVVNKGVIGITTSGILTRLESNLSKYKPNMVVSMIGINDMVGFNDREKHLPCESPSASKIILFIRSFRVYKLARLLSLHIRTKVQEIGSSLHHTQQAGPFSTEEEDLKKSIILNPEDDTAYVKLSQWYQGQNRPAQVEALAKKAISLNPQNEDAYIELARAYNYENKFNKAIETAKKAIALNPGNDWTYWELGIYSSMLGKENQAERFFRKAIVLNPKNVTACLSLVNCYLKSGKFTEAEKILKETIGLNPNVDRVYAALVTLYKENGKNAFIQDYYKKANELRGKIFYSIVYQNYQKLKTELDKKGIKLVCVQYPVRSIEPLKKIFEGEAGIIFVDNEKIFKDAINKEGYKEYFVDMFGGDFGHCTPKGNRLLAENIAKSIVKEVFGK